ncbi:hypothetical protein ACFX19_030161 [Malus domestica]
MSVNKAFCQAHGGNVEICRGHMLRPINPPSPVDHVMLRSSLPKRFDFAAQIKSMKTYSPTQTRKCSLQQEAVVIVRDRPLVNLGNLKLLLTVSLSSQLDIVENQHDPLQIF